MRVGIIALLQESNTFIHGETTLARDPVKRPAAPPYPNKSVK